MRCHSDTFDEVKPAQPTLPVEQVSRRDQIGRIEAFGKPRVDGLQNLSGTALIALPDP